MIEKRLRFVPRLPKIKKAAPIHSINLNAFNLA